MKRLMKLMLTALALMGLLTGCGADKEDQPARVDLAEFYAELEDDCDWGDGYMADIEGEMLESYYPGLSEISTKQFIAKMPMMSSVVNEVVFLQCEMEEDAEKATEILQSRINYQVGDENNPGGAWYPESIEAWKQGQVIQQGTYVAMIASAEHQDSIEEQFTALFA